MTKKQKELADELLRMANDWQWRIPTWGKPDVWPIDSRALDPEIFDAGASCALSEVAGMGITVLNHDGSKCEKTHELSNVRMKGIPLLRPVLRDDIISEICDAAACTVGVFILLWAWLR